MKTLLSSIAYQLPSLECSVVGRTVQCSAGASAGSASDPHPCLQGWQFFMILVGSMSVSLFISVVKASGLL